MSQATSQATSQTTSQATMVQKVCRNRVLAGVFLVAMLLTGQHVSAAEDCGDVTIASMSWPSAELIAEIDKLILSKGYGCNVRLIPGDTMSTFSSMAENAQPDLAPELWINAVRAPLDEAIADGRLLIGARVLADGGEEGWWIPRYVADAHPEIRSAADALARPDLFPAPDDPERGAIYNCPVGWNCQVITANLFTAYGGEQTGFKLIHTGSAAGLDGSIVQAFQAGRGWLGFYWSPTAMLGSYDMVRLDTGPHDKQEWDACTVIRDCPDPKVNGWADSEVFSVVTRDFATRAAVAMDYIMHRSWNNATVNTLLAWMAKHHASGEEAAVHFLAQFEGIWSHWVSREAKRKILDH